MDLSWVKDVERQLRVLAQRTAHLPTRVRGGGSGGGGGGAAASILTTAPAYDELIDPEDTPAIFAKVTDGPQKGQLYKASINESDELYWECIDEHYEADTKAGLANNTFVQAFAVGRVGEIYYRRNEAGNGWIAMNEFE